MSSRYLYCSHLTGVTPAPGTVAAHGQHCTPAAACRPVTQETGAGQDGDARRQRAGWGGTARQPGERAVTLHSSRDLGPTEAVVPRQPPRVLEPCSSGDPHTLPTERRLRSSARQAPRPPSPSQSSGRASGDEACQNYGLLAAVFAINHLCPLPGGLFKGSFISIIITQNSNFGRRQPREHSICSPFDLLVLAMQNNLCSLWCWCCLNTSSMSETLVSKGIFLCFLI